MCYGNLAYCTHMHVLYILVHLHVYMYMEGVTQAVVGVNLHNHVEPC